MAIVNPDLKELYLGQARNHKRLKTITSQKRLADILPL